MKLLSVFPLLFGVYFSAVDVHMGGNPAAITDSAVINHTLDGLVNEWPQERFTTHKETTIRYAADNNRSDLYLAISIPSPATQARIMQAGMSLYIDVNGKKRVSRGVQFPIINEGSPGLPAERNPDIKTVRSMMILNLIKLKLFGFSDDSPPYQELLMPGSVNVAYGWDSADIMHIEYRIPFSILGDPASLNQKNISIGWKLHAVQSAAQNPSLVSTSTRVVGVRPGSRAPRTDVPTPTTDRRNAMSEEQQLWTKYLIVIAN